MRLPFPINKAAKLSFGRPAHKSAESWKKISNNLKTVRVRNWMVNISFYNNNIVVTSGK
jgi:hypothetical protein